MKKLSFLLLTIACIALVGCNKNDNNEPTEPVVPTADFVLKFFTSDSLLQYVDFTISDTLDSSIDCSNYTIAKLDTLNADQEDWEFAVRKAVVMSKPTGSQTYDNTKVITLKVRLAQNDKQHAFRILYTRNKVVDHSGEIDFILGGSTWNITSSSEQPQTQQAVGHIGIETNILNDFLNTVVTECTLSFVY